MQIQFREREATLAGSKRRDADEYTVIFALGKWGTATEGAVQEGGSG